jgi:hypothetical protein
MDRHPHVPTPAPTKWLLVATLVVTVAATGTFLRSTGAAGDARAAAPYLVLFTVLFFLRVAGQLFVRTSNPAWLPPTEQWNLSPYALLLPAQLAILGLMIWIDLDFARQGTFWTLRRPELGAGVLWFALVYASAMVVRYVVRMARRRTERWFGGTIPIIFHWVLAAYLLVFATFHVSG